MNNRNIFIILFISIIFIGIIVFSKYQKDFQEVFVSNFKECEAAGYPVMESYPRQCAAPDGQVFIEEVDEIPVEINVSEQDLR